MPSSFETLHLGQDAPSPLYLQNNKVCKRCKIILLFGHSKIQTDSDIWPRGINQECRNERLSRQEGRTENGQTEGVKECRNCRECIEMAYHGPALLWMRLTWTPCTDAMSGVPGGFLDAAVVAVLASVTEVWSLSPLSVVLGLTRCSLFLGVTQSNVALPLQFTCWLKVLQPQGRKRGTNEGMNEGVKEGRNDWLADWLILTVWLTEWMDEWDWMSQRIHEGVSETCVP